MEPLMYVVLELSDEQGPGAVYLSKAPGDVREYDGSGDWFKIDERTFDFKRAYGNGPGSNDDPNKAPHAWDLFLQYEVSS